MAKGALRGNNNVPVTLMPSSVIRISHARERRDGLEIKEHTLCIQKDAGIAEVFIVWPVIVCVIDTCEVEPP